MKSAFSPHTLAKPANLAKQATIDDIVGSSLASARSPCTTKTRYMVRKRDPNNVAGWFIRHSALTLEELQAEMGEEHEVRVAKYQDE